MLTQSVEAAVGQKVWRGGRRRSAPGVNEDLDIKKCNDTIRPLGGVSVPYVIKEGRAVKCVVNPNDTLLL